MYIYSTIQYNKIQKMAEIPRRTFLNSFIESPQFPYSINNSLNTNDVSFSIPDWKLQEIKSLNYQYEKQIYTAVPLSLTDFDTKQEIQFLSKPDKCQNQKFAYERKLLYPQDFSILAFILCLQQTLIGNHQNNHDKLEKFKKKLNELDLCVLTGIPLKMMRYYDNKILKKLLFQYINKGSYNVSLLQVLLRRNSTLKFALSLVSRSILKNRKLITQYTERVPFHVEMRNCGDQFGVLSTIKVKQKSIQTQNFLIQMNTDVKMLRKQNIIELKLDSQIKKSNLRPKSQSKLSYNSKLSPRNSKLIFRQKILKQNFRQSQKQRSKSKQKQRPCSRSNKKKQIKRSNSLVNFFRKIICF